MIVIRLPSVSLLCLGGWQEDNIRTSIRQFCDGERREDEAATAPSETSGQLAENVEAVLAGYRPIYYCNATTSRKFKKTKMFQPSTLQDVGCLVFLKQ